LEGLTLALERPSKDLPGSWEGLGRSFQGPS
jgi:hypothetical protein